MNSKNYVRILPLLLLLKLTGCVTDSGTSVDTRVIYQSPILQLEKGTKVQTKLGVYQAQTDEVWHSDYRYRQLEQEVIQNY